MADVADKETFTETILVYDERYLAMGLEKMGTEAL